MGIVVQSSREILHRNPFPAGDPRHAAAGEEVLDALLLGTDAEGFAGDRILVAKARAWLSEAPGFGASTVGEAYRLRSADRVEVLFLRAAGNPRALPGLAGRFDVGLAHAVEVTRGNDLAFRTSPCWRRAGGRGWVVVDPGEVPAVARDAGREALEEAQRRALARGLELEAEAGAAVAAAGPKRVQVALALRATSLPRSIRDRAAAHLPPVAPLSDVVVALADVAGSSDREEGESYARAAGRLVLCGPAVAAAAAVAEDA